jgi:hypothetical protein
MAKKCLVCGKDAVVNSIDSNHKFVECKVCGRFQINTFDWEHEWKPKDKNLLASYLFYNGNISQPIKILKEKFFNFIGKKEKYDETESDNPNCYLVTKHTVENWYPQSFSEKIDVFLLGIFKLSKYWGDRVLLFQEELFSSTFVQRYDENGRLRDEDTCRSQAFFF